MILTTSTRISNHNDAMSRWKNYRNHTIASIVSYPLVSFILISNQWLSKYESYPLFLRIIFTALVCLLFSNYSDWRPEKEIQEAILNNNDSEVIRIISDRSWKVKICCLSGCTPLHWACNSSINDETFVFLLESGGNPNARSNSEETPVHWAVSKSSLIKLDYLIQHGAKLDVQDEKGKTPLHWAVHFNSLPTVTFLVEHGADRTICDNDGKTPLELSRSKSEWEDVFNYLNSLDSTQT